MLSTDIPAKFPVAFASGAASGFTRAIPTSGSGSDGSANLTLGFPPITFQPVSTGGIPPFGQDFNGLNNQITAWLRFANQAGGPVYYDATFSTAIGGYPKGAVLRVGDTSTQTTYWVSTAESNTTNPDTGGAGWIPVSTSFAHYRTANFNAIVGHYVVDTTAGQVTATLPSSPIQGQYLTFTDARKTWSVNQLNLARNGKTIQGVASDFTCKTRDGRQIEFSMVWDTVPTTPTWRFV